jgi:hypothetical protein
MEKLETDLANVKDLDPVANGLRPNDGVPALVVPNLAPQTVDAVGRETSNVIESSFGLANDRHVVPPPFPYNFSKSGAIGLSDCDEFSSVNGITPDGAPFEQIFKTLTDWIRRKAIPILAVVMFDPRSW